MKRLVTFASATLVAVALAHGQDAATTADAPALPAPAPAIAPDPAAAPTAVHAVDTAAFVRGVTAMNDLEIASARIALRRAERPQVRALARRLAGDHAAISERFGEMVMRDGIRPEATGAVTPAPDESAPTAPGGVADPLEALRKVPDDGFDALFLKVQADAHTDAIRLFTSFSEAGDNAGLRDFAVSTLPMLQEHQQAVAELAR